jgi:hypothetical protein
MRAKAHALRSRKPYSAHRRDTASPALIRVKCANSGAVNFAQQARAKQL